jgi:hypothetical protein
MRARRRQRGWVGLIVILLALAVVALLGRTVLREMGLLGARPPVAQTGEPGRLPSGAQPAAEPASATPSSSAPIDRARAVEGMVLQGAAERGRQVDDGAR